MKKIKGKKLLDGLSIGNTIFIYFTVTSIIAVLIIGFSIYIRLSKQLEDTIKEENIGLVEQLNSSLDTYLRSIMKLSDSIYYGLIKNEDINDEDTLNGMNLLYDNSKDHIENIAIFSNSGELMNAIPAARIKPYHDINNEEWFQKNIRRTENIYFSNPHIQYIFDISDKKYKWVISLTRAIELTDNGKTSWGVLLIDVSYNSLINIMENIKLGNSGYVYLIDSTGEIIWHPKAQLIYSGIEKENNEKAKDYFDGSHTEYFDGIERNITIKTVGYTGWKIVGVAPRANLSLNNTKTKLFTIFIVASILGLIFVINAYISLRITDPIQELEKSVNELESGNLDTDIYVGGSSEIQHLGKSLTDMRAQIKKLMNDIVLEHESKRKSEFDTLQSQINPHFLYNTLDIIVWMIENERQEQAVEVVTALARFFRISLSKGKNIITVKDEVEHVRNYLTIQKMRFKNKFEYKISCDDKVENLSSIKLILQPLVENAIYHGMEFMDGDGMIDIQVWESRENLFFRISDNGPGMSKERVKTLLNDDVAVKSKKGSGIGVKNVNERIKLYFGKEYGLDISSEPDEGTIIIIRLPAIVYDEGTS